MQEHLGLRPHPQGEPANVGAGKPQFSRPMLWLYQSRALKVSARLPAPLRRAGRKALLRAPDARRDLIESAAAPLPSDVEQRFRCDDEALIRLLDGT